MLQYDGMKVNVGIERGYPVDNDYGDFYIFCAAIVCFFVLLILLTYKKNKRLKEEHKKWLDIKELEKDYDVFVTDEYAHQITDIKSQMQYIQDLNNFSSSQYRKFGNTDAVDKSSFFQPQNHYKRTYSQKVKQFKQEIKDQEKGLPSPFPSPKYVMIRKDTYM